MYTCNSRIEGNYLKKLCNQKVVYAQHLFTHQNFAYVHPTPLCFRDVILTFRVDFDLEKCNILIYAEQTLRTAPRYIVCSVQTHTHEAKSFACAGATPHFNAILKVSQKTKFTKSNNCIR